jgi:hypothetical protein
VGFERDFLLMNRLFTRASLDLGIVNFEAGLYFGLFNLDITATSIGFSAIIQVKAPSDRVFGSFGIDFPFNRTLNAVDEYAQDFLGVTFGIKVPHAILRADIRNRGLTQRHEHSAIITGRWSRFQVSAGTDWDFPVSFCLDIGYQQIKWLYIVSKTYEYDYSSVYAGLDVSWFVTNRLKLYLETQAPVYPWVYPRVNFTTPQEALLIGFTLGAVWKVQ